MVFGAVVGHSEWVYVVELKVDQDGHELLDGEAHLLQGQVPPVVCGGRVR